MRSTTFWSSGVLCGKNGWVYQVFSELTVENCDRTSMIKHFVINISPSRVSIFSTSILVIIIVIVSISTVIVTIVLFLTPETRSQDS